MWKEFTIFIFFKVIKTVSDWNIGVPQLSKCHLLHFETITNYKINQVILEKFSCRKRWSVKKIVTFIHS